MKTYPLEIENIGEDVYQLMSRGHHDLVEFMNEVKRYRPTWTMGRPSHIYFKATPTRKNGYKCWYHECSKDTKGAFPVTYVQEGCAE